MRGGGRLLLHGRLPVLDDDGTPCTVLADTLGLAVDTRVESAPDHFTSVRATGWAGEQPEVRVGYLERLRTTGAPGTRAEPLALDVADGSPVAVDVTVEGGGRAIVMACDYPCHLDFWRALFARIGVHRRIVAHGGSPGLVTTTTADATGQRLVHLVNVAPVPQKFTLEVAGEPFADGASVELTARSGLMLPHGHSPGRCRTALGDDRTRRPRRRLGRGAAARRRAGKGAHRHRPGGCRGR